MKIQNSDIESQQRSDYRICRESRYLYEEENSAKYSLFMCCTVFTVLVFEPTGIEGSVPKSEFSDVLQRVKLPVMSSFIFAFLLDHMSDILFLNQSSLL